MYIIRTKISIDRVERKGERRQERDMRIYDNLQRVYITFTAVMAFTIYGFLFRLYLPLFLKKKTFVG